MPFPATLDAMFSSGYEYARWEHCATCGEPVEIYTTPGKREMAFEPMCSRESPAVRHYEVCKPKEAQDGNSGMDVQDEDAQGRSGDSGPHSEPKLDESPDRHLHSYGKAVLPDGGHDAKSEGIKLYGVTDPNHQLIAVGWDDGVLVCQWAKGKGKHTGVPEDIYLKLRRVPFAYRQYKATIKGKFPYTKLE